MQSISIPRILAIDLRSNRMAYAAVDEAGTLLDSGAAQFASVKTARARTSGLIRAFHPSVVVLRKLGAHSLRRRPRWRYVERQIRKEAKRFTVPIAWVTESALKAFFRGLGCRNKFQVAALLADQFPQIARKVPRPRESYEPEPWTVCYFDAISLAITYLAVSDNFEGAGRSFSQKLESFRRPPNDVAE